MMSSSSVCLLLALAASLGFDRCSSARSGGAPPRPTEVADQPVVDSSVTQPSSVSASASGPAVRPIVAAAPSRRAISPLFDAATRARMYASAPTSRLGEVRRGLALCGLRYSPPSSRTSTVDRWLLGIATGGLSELAVRSSDADFFSPDLRLDAQFGEGPTVVASARDLRNADLVAVPVERLERGATVQIALFDRDTLSADDELLRRSVRWNGERTITIASGGARVSCRLVEWSWLLPRATAALRAAERSASSLASRAERVASAIAAARTPGALIDASFDAELGRAEQTLARAAWYAAINPDWTEFSQVSRSLDRTAQPVRDARLARARRGFDGPSDRDADGRYVSGQCVAGRLRVSFELGRDAAPTRVVAIDWRGGTIALTGRALTRRAIRTFVASGRAVGSGLRCEAPFAIVTFAGGSSALRMVNGGAS